jgi:hypothetical protein
MCLAGGRYSNGRGGRAFPLTAGQLQGDSQAHGPHVAELIGYDARPPEVSPCVATSLFLVSGLFALGLLTAGSLVTSPPASAATKVASTTTCSNGVDNTGGLGLICEVTIVNTINPSGGS